MKTTIVFIFFLVTIIKIIKNNKIKEIKKSNNSSITKHIFQTSKYPIPKYVLTQNKLKFNDWNYTFFSDDDIINFFINNPLKEFPDIIKKFKYFNRGEHKADLFRYYYLYINGGVFIDSDVLLKKNIEDIIQNYDFVSVKSIVPNTLFNGFIATEKKNVIIYEALKMTYTTNNIQLKKNYHLICNQLFNIYNKYHNQTNILLKEYHDPRLNNIGVITIDNNDEHVLTHFSWSKQIPKHFKYFYK